MIKSLFQKNKLSIIGAVIGAVGGLSYWKFIGCESGTCKITSSPLNSTLYFAILGALTLSMFKKEK